MDTNWLVITAGVAVAAAGLYLLIGRRRSGFGWSARVGAGLVFLAAAVVAPEVFRPTGTFLGLLSFLFPATAAVGCLIAVAALRSPEQGLLAFAAAGLCLALLLLFSGGVLVPAMVVLLAAAPAAVGSRLRSRWNPVHWHPQELRDDHLHEPLWGCMAWAALVLGMLRCLCIEGVGPQALLNNQLVVGSVVTATGALTLMVRRNMLWSVLGLGAATLGPVLLLSAFGRFHGESGADVLAVVILCGAAAHAVMLLRLDAHRETGGADRPLPEGSATP
jgi:NADH:ubiquinone oxidoreductase subunit K